MTFSDLLHLISPVKSARAGSAPLIGAVAALAITLSGAVADNAVAMWAGAVAYAASVLAYVAKCRR